LNQIEIERPFLHGGLDVHDRAFTGDGDRLLEGADAQVRVHRGDEIGRQHQPFASHGTESGQRKGDRVGTGPEVEDPVLAGPVGHRAADFLDEFRAGGLYCHAW
jgi:hypothetical protein